MKSLKTNQSGFVTIILMLLAILAAAIVFVYMRVARAQNG